MISPGAGLCPVVLGSRQWKIFCQNKTYQINMLEESLWSQSEEGPVWIQMGQFMGRSASVQHKNRDQEEGIPGVEGSSVAEKTHKTGDCWIGRKRKL